NRDSDLIMPGRSAMMPVLVEAPGQPGVYTLKIQIERKLATEGSASEGVAECFVKLNVTENAIPVQSALVELAQLCRLPQGYEPAANGRLGRIKSWLKEKLLGGFRRRYVDVLSRQQSAANGLILAAMAELYAKVERLSGVTEGDKPE